MKNNTKQILIGTLLVLAGILFLIQQIFDLAVGGLFVGLIFAVGSAVFFYLFVKDHEKWWALIPGFTLLGLGMLIASGSLFPGFSSRFGGTLFLGSIALGFLSILLFKPEHWWAVIPAGVLATLALIAGIRNGGMIQGALFFLGIGATFAVLGLLPSQRKEKWPWIPATICLVLGALLMIGSGALVDTVFGWVWAIGFLVVGILLVVKSVVKKNQD